MSTKTLTNAIMDWGVEVLPEVQEAYDHATDERAGLPDIAVEVTGWRITAGPVDQRLAKLQVQQQDMKVTDLEFILVVAPEPAETAEDQLKDFSDRLVDALLQDPSLGNRVAWVNNNPRVSFRPPLVEFEDGTRGRIVTLFLQVGQTVEVH